MSSYYKDTKHPETGSWERALWLDDHFGSHHYGVKFSDGKFFDPWKIKLETKDGGVQTPPTQRSNEEIWNKLTDVLEEQFPKNKCQERGHALVLLTHAKIALDTQAAESASNAKAISDHSDRMIGYKDKEIELIKSQLLQKDKRIAELEEQVRMMRTALEKIANSMEPKIPGIAEHILANAVNDAREALSTPPNPTAYQKVIEGVVEAARAIKKSPVRLNDFLMVKLDKAFDDLDKFNSGSK